MASNSFGQLFRITTWGESHGRAIGVVIDGCPAGLEISEEEIWEELKRRRPGRNDWTTSRNEEDRPEIYSGVFEGKTTGAPISIIIPNKDADSSQYLPIKDLYRPGHANFTYLAKYGIFDYRGGGRASARETAARVAAGAVAKKLLAFFDMEVLAYTCEVGGIAATPPEEWEELKKTSRASPLFCPDTVAEKKIAEKIALIKEEGDSLGGIIEMRTTKLPVGLGDPIYEKLEAKLAKAMLSLPASKGVEFGVGFAASRHKGSEMNDLFVLHEKVTMSSNHSGGTLGGISTGLPLICRVAFKPTSSIKKPQQTVSLNKELKEFRLPEGSRHDPVAALRAAPIVEAMGALVLADTLLLQRSSRLIPDTQEEA
ncbi:MAG: chorismate synthase [Chlamydiales bacterium]